MHLILSGEGPSDLGTCSNATALCDSDGFAPGPMVWFVDQLIELYQGFELSHLANGLVTFVSKQYLVGHQSPRSKKAVRLTGKTRQKETLYFERNTQALAEVAKQLAVDKNDKVVAVLFRDADGTASSGRGEWQAKWRSMSRGFRAQEFYNGVPMIPKPKSEAWLLCALKPNPYQHCNKLEDESGNDRGQNPLKAQLEQAYGGPLPTATLNQLWSQRDNGSALRLNHAAADLDPNEAEKNLHSYADKVLACQKIGYQGLTLDNEWDDQYDH